MVNITKIYSLINYNHLKYSLENMNHTSITFQIIYFMIFFTKFISESHVDILLKVFFPIASTYGVLTIHTWIHIQVFSKFQSKCKGQNYRILNLSPSSNTIFSAKGYPPDLYHHSSIYNIIITSINTKVNTHIRSCFISKIVLSGAHFGYWQLVYIRIPNN